MLPFQKRKISRRQREVALAAEEDGSNSEEANLESSPPAEEEEQGSRASPPLGSAPCGSLKRPASPQLSEETPKRMKNESSMLKREPVRMLFLEKVFV